MTFPFLSRKKIIALRDGRKEGREDGASSVAVGAEAILMAKKIIQHECE